MSTRTKFEPRRLHPADFGAACDLLTTCALPTADLRPDRLTHFFGMFDRDRLIAIGGLEVLGGDALLRSLAVQPAARGGGLGARLVAVLETEAGKLGVRNLYLLTDGADTYFERFAYRRLPRSNAPAAIAASAQFTELCPDAAVLMHKGIDDAQ